MPPLDSSQLEFCQSADPNIRLLAPAGCGKTTSLLHRCRTVASRASTPPRFLIITFTNAAAEELKDRHQDDPDFLQILRDRVTVTTLNAYGWRRLRSRVPNARLLSTPNDRHFAVQNQLRPIWLGHPHLEQAVTARGRNTRTLMDVMDNLKSMGFDHISDTNFDRFRQRLQHLQAQGASWRVKQQFDLLTELGILDSRADNSAEHATASARSFYNRFFPFWRDATSTLLAQSTFTFEDQKYWAYQDFKSPGPDGKPKPHVYGAARYDHVLVDEFQDINPLDLALIKMIVDRHQSTLTIVGDDDQAIFEWRGASPEYIIRPQQYFGAPFKDYQLATNYRSPQNIVRHSQKLIGHNKNRVSKQVRAARGTRAADIQVLSIDGISDRLRYVTEIVRDTTYPGRVAVIGHRRGDLIPYEIYFASDGAPFKTAADLDIFAAKALDDFTDLVGVWDRSANRVRSSQTVSDALTICNLIKRFPLNRKDLPSLKSHLQRARPATTVDAVQAIADYSGAPLSGKSHDELHDTAYMFLNADGLYEAIRVIDKNFAGLSFDRDKQEESIWHTAPPLLQLADIAESEGYEPDDLIDRIETAKMQIKEYQELEDPAQDSAPARAWERPLHLMTAWRAKGKEFDTAILLDTVDGIWPDYRADDERTMEAERRLFYVAFTRARRRVIMLKETRAPISPFVEELDLPADALH